MVDGKGIWRVAPWVFDLVVSMAEMWAGE